MTDRVRSRLGRSRTWIPGEPVSSYPLFALDDGMFGWPGFERAFTLSRVVRRISPCPVAACECDTPDCSRAAGYASVRLEGEVHLIVDTRFCRFGKRPDRFFRAPRTGAHGMLGETGTPRTWEMSSSTRTGSLLSSISQRYPSGGRGTLKVGSRSSTSIVGVWLG